MLSEVFAEFTNAKYGITSKVVAGQKGAFNVVLKDDDSGEFFPSAKIFAAGDFSAAVVYAKKIANV